MSKPILAAILSVSGASLTDEEKFILEKSNPVGISLFGRNIQSKSQLKTLIKEINEVIGRRDVLIAIDQEGGRVRRLTPPDYRPYAAHIEIGQLTQNQAIKASQFHAELISNDLHELGINVNFAPCIDRLYDNTSEALKSRCFSKNLDLISILGKIMVDTYIKNGILPCIKHIPGLGSAINDSHLTLPQTPLSKELFEADLAPFIKCNHSPLAMTAHLLIPHIDTQNALTQSKQGIKQLIREKIGFNGFLISDDINMHALKGTLTQKALKTIEAGCDCICYSMGNTEGLRELSKNCPKLSDEAQQRLDNAIQILHNIYEQPNIEFISDEYSKLLSDITPYQETYDATEVLHKLQTKE